MSHIGHRSPAHLGTGVSIMPAAGCRRGEMLRFGCTCMGLNTSMIFYVDITITDMYRIPPLSYERSSGTILRLDTLLVSHLGDYKSGSNEIRACRAGHGRAGRSHCRTHGRFESMRRCHSACAVSSMRPRMVQRACVGACWIICSQYWIWNRIPLLFPRLPSLWPWKSFVAWWPSREHRHPEPSPRAPPPHASRRAPS